MQGNDEKGILVQAGREEGGRLWVGPTCPERMGPEACITGRKELLHLGPNFVRAGVCCLERRDKGLDAADLRYLRFPLVGRGDQGSEKGGPVAGGK